MVHWASMLRVVSGWREGMMSQRPLESPDIWCVELAASSLRHPALTNINTSVPQAGQFTRIFSV